MFLRDVRYLSRSNPKTMPFLADEKGEVEFEKNSETDISVKLLCSVYKMIACTQHNGRSFSSKNGCFACFETKSHPQNCGIRFLKVDQVVDVLSLKLGGIYWIPPGECLQN